MMNLHYEWREYADDDEHYEDYEWDYEITNKQAFNVLLENHTSAGNMNMERAHDIIELALTEKEINEVLKDEYNDRPFKSIYDYIEDSIEYCKKKHIEYGAVEMIGDFIEDLEAMPQELIDEIKEEFEYKAKWDCYDNL